MVCMWRQLQVTVVVSYLAAHDESWSSPVRGYVHYYYYCYYRAVLKEQLAAIRLGFLLRAVGSVSDSNVHTRLRAPLSVVAEAYP